MMKEKLILNSGEELVLESRKSKGTMAQTDIEHYSIVNANGVVVGNVLYEDHTSLNGFRRTQTIIQTDLNGNVLVRASW